WCCHSDRRRGWPGDGCFLTRHRGGPCLTQAGSLVSLVSGFGRRIVDVDRLGSIQQRVAELKRDVGMCVVIRNNLRQRPNVISGGKLAQVVVQVTLELVVPDPRWETVGVYIPRYQRGALVS